MSSEALEQSGFGGLAELVSIGLRKLRVKVNQVTGSFKGDIAALAARLAQGLRTAAWSTILPSIIDAAERDPELAQLHSALHRELMAPYVAIAERAVKKKELASGHTPSGVAAAIVAPLF